MAEIRLIRMSAPKRKTSTAVDDAPHGEQSYHPLALHHLSQDKAR